LRILYETEKKVREEIEKTLIEKADESNKQIESLSIEVANLGSIINELRSQYNNWQNQFCEQIVTFSRIKLNTFRDYKFKKIKGWPGQVKRGLEGRECGVDTRK
jgi:hypothetical protein